MNQSNRNTVWFVGRSKSGKTALIRRLTCDLFDGKQTDKPTLHFKITHGSNLHTSLDADIVEVCDGQTIPARRYDVIVVLETATYQMKNSTPADVCHQIIKCESLQDICESTSAHGIKVSAKTGFGCSQLMHEIFKMLMNSCIDKVIAPASSLIDPPADGIVKFEIGATQFAFTGIKPTKIQTDNEKTTVYF